MKVELYNGNIMVEAIQRKRQETTNSVGIIIPDEVLEDEQVAQGIVIESSSEQFKKGDILFFHKVLPVDVNMKLSADEELKNYFFIKDIDVICKIIDE